MFLTKEELKTVSDLSIIDKITRLDDEIVTEIIEESIDMMRSYLSRFYDDIAIFAARGAERKKSVLKKLKDIVIYEIYNRNKWGVDPSTERSYLEAMNWLEKINTGELGDRTLPVRPEAPATTEGTDGDVRFGGNRRYASAY